MRITRLLAASSFLLVLLACGTIRAQLDARPTTRVTTVPADQACTAAEESETRLTGAFLRLSDASGLTFVPVLVQARENRNGLRDEVILTDNSQAPDADDIRGTTFEGRKDAVAKARRGFGNTGLLPNVYDVTYDAKKTTFSGPMVLGSGAVLSEIPTSGSVLFSGTISLDLITQDDSGAQSQQRSTGAFEMRAGYGSGRAQITANDFSPSLPFDRLEWSGLVLCGTRFVSGGQGVVTVQQGDGPRLPPFKEGRDAPVFTALFESAQFAPAERLGPPASVGGVFVIQSDSGTITSVFLSDQPPVEEEPTDA